MKTRSLKLPADLDADLVRFAARRKRSTSSVVREAVAQYLAREDEQILADSVLARTKDLVGSLEGPGDLSYNKTHLKDYGR